MKLKGSFFWTIERRWPREKNLVNESNHFKYGIWNRSNCILSLFVEEEYERQLQEVLPKLPPGSENEKIVLESFPENRIDIMVNGLVVDVWIWPAVYDRDHHSGRQKGTKPTTKLAMGEWSEPTIWRSFPSGDFSANQLFIFILWNFETHRLPTTEKSVFTHV